MGKNITDMILQSDFSAETDFKNILRKRLFENKTEVLRFHRLGDADLDLVSAAGESDLLRQKDPKKTNPATL